MTVIKGLEETEVELLDITVDPFKKLWDFYKIIWYKTDKPYDEKSEEQRQICFDILNFKTLPTPQETIGITFRIRNISKVGLARITRARVGWTFNSVSQAPQKTSQKIMVPLNLMQSKYKNEIEELLAKSEELYNKLYAEEMPPQDIRYISPMGQVGDLNCHVNFLALRQYASRRMCNGLEDELNYIGRLIVREIRNRIVAGTLHKNWEYLLEKIDCTCNGIVCKNIDKVYGNCGRCKSGGVAQTNADYKFNNSSWKKELLRMDKSLLLNGEDKMIEVFKKE